MIYKFDKTTEQFKFSCLFWYKMPKQAITVETPLGFLEVRSNTKD